MSNMLTCIYSLEFLEKMQLIVNTKSLDPIRQYIGGYCLLVTSIYVMLNMKYSENNWFRKRVT